MLKPLAVCCALALMFSSQAQITISLDPSQELKEISPYIYGKNNSTSDNPNSPLSASDWQFLKDAGVKMFRENGGNNSSKYNWRLKLSSHPDWYNNVYDHDWDYEADQILENTEGTQALYALQLLGKAASSKDNNFNDWAYNKSNWWDGVHNNWAGGGGPDSDGDPNLYLIDWPADSTVGIFDHWFNDLELDSTRLVYWNMDNEGEIWNGTHDDVQAELPAEEYMQRYLKVAELARKKFPSIKIVGPAFTNEWQWYTWNNTKVKDDKGDQYPWFEYFIKRISERQDSTGLKLLDVLDYHFYPGSQDDIDLTLELHKVWYDRTWSYSKANGVKASGSTGWNEALTKEYIFARSLDLLDEYMGDNHGVTMGLSECGSIHNEDPNVVACWYASHLGEFANNGVELFTPWDWYTGQYEVLSLFSHNYGDVSVQTSSSSADVVGSYAALSTDGDFTTLVLVNKDQNATQDVVVDVANFNVFDGNVTYRQLANLPSAETFKGLDDNALTVSTVNVLSKSLSMTLPTLSVTMITLPKEGAELSVAQTLSPSLYSVSPNPFKNEIKITSVDECAATITDLSGSVVDQFTFRGTSFNGAALKPGVYMIQLTTNKGTTVQKIIKE